MSDELLSIAEVERREEKLTKFKMDAVDLWWKNSVRPELERATRKFGSFNSSHEGYAILLEEVDEMWEEVKNNDRVRAKEEAIQVAAMAIRYLVDVKI